MRKLVCSVLTAVLLVSCSREAGLYLDKLRRDLGIDQSWAPPPGLDITTVATQKQREQAALQYKTFRSRMTVNQSKSWLARMKNLGVQYAAVQMDQGWMLVLIKDGQPIPCVHGSKYRSGSASSVIQLAGCRAICIK